MENTVRFASPLRFGLSPAKHSLVQITLSSLLKNRCMSNRDSLMNQIHHYFDTCMGPSCPSGRCLGQCSAGVAVLQHSLCFRLHHKGFAPTSWKKAVQNLFRRMKNYAEVMFIYIDIDIP